MDSERPNIGGKGVARRGFKAWLDVVVTSGTNLPHGASLPFTVLHVTPMDDNRVSACDGTATMALVCRIILPSAAPHPDVQTDIHI